MPACIGGGSDGDLEFKSLGGGLAGFEDEGEARAGSTDGEYKLRDGGRGCVTVSKVGSRKRLDALSEPAKVAFGYPVILTSFSSFTYKFRPLSPPAEPPFFG